MKSLSMVGAVVAVAAVMAASNVDTTYAVPWSQTLMLAEGYYSGQRTTVASSTDGSVVVAWSDDEGILARRVAGNGTRGPLRRLGSVAESAEGPQVAVDASGAAVVVWLGADNSVRARRMSSSGKLGPLHTLAPAYPSGPYNSPDARVALDSSGTATVVWARTVTEFVEPKGARVVSSTAHARRFDARGRLGPTIDLPTGEGIDSSPRVLLNRQGRAIVVWVVRKGDQYSIRATRIAPDGSLAPVRDIVGPQSRWFEGGPELAINESGHAVLAWVETGNGELTIMTRRMGPSGEPGRSATLATGILFFGPRVVLAADGRITVVWRDATSVDTIRARQIGPDDSVGPLLALSMAPGDVSAPDVALDRMGSMTSVWSETLYRQTPDGPVPSGTAMRSRSISPDGRLGSLVALAPTVKQSYASPPRIVEARGVLTAVWSRFPNVLSPWSSIEFARRVRSCPAAQLKRAWFAAPVASGKGIRATFAFDGIADIRIGRVSLRYRTSAGTIRVMRLRVLRHGRDGVTHGLRLGASRSAVRHALRFPHAARIRVHLRSRPYATGCAFGVSRLAVASPRTN